MKCKNAPNKNYTGKENTPLGRGYSAVVEKVGTKMKGRDGKMYMVKKYKNGKRWIRLTSQTRKTSPKGFLSTEWNGMKLSKNVIEPLYDFYDKQTKIGLIIKTILGYINTFVTYEGKIISIDSADDIVIEKIVQENLNVFYARLVSFHQHFKKVIDKSSGKKEAFVRYYSALAPLAYISVNG